MFQKLLFSSLFLLLVTFAFGQVTKPAVSGEGEAFQTLVPEKGQPIPLLGFVNPQPEEGPFLNPEVAHIRSITHGSAEQDAIRQAKEEKGLVKLNYLGSFGPDLEGGDPPLFTPRTPQVGKLIEGNTQGFSFPPDNHVAVSDNGVIVSVINTSISYYRTDGTPLLINRPFTSFLSNLGLNSFFFDPRVIYDPTEDKFIFVCLHGNEPEETRVVVGFSLTNNPLQGWNIYALDGDPAVEPNFRWFDFPSVGISTADLFISGNMFLSDDFIETIIYQIDKSDGFAGESLDNEYFRRVKDGDNQDAFTVVPVSYGFDGTYGPGIYLVSTKSFAGSRVYLYDIDGDLDDDQELTSFSIPIASYEVPGDASQKGSAKLLDVGDCRVQTSYYDGEGIVHLGHIRDNGDGFSSLRYIRLDVSDLSVDYNDYQQSGYDLAYPAIAPIGIDGSDPSIMMCFLRSNRDIFPEFLVFNADEDFNPSASVIIKEGSAPIAVSGENFERWGDYNGAARQHGQSEPCIWFFGCVGQDNAVQDHTYGNWIAQIKAEPVAVREQKPLVEDLKLFPNPVVDAFQLEFTVEEPMSLKFYLADLEGRLVEHFFDRRVKAGVNLFAFNKAPLAAGTYLVIIKNETGKIIASEKIIIAR